MACDNDCMDDAAISRCVDSALLGKISDHTIQGGLLDSNGDPLGSGVRVARSDDVKRDLQTGLFEIKEENLKDRANLSDKLAEVTKTVTEAASKASQALTRVFTGKNLTGQGTQDDPLRLDMTIDGAAAPMNVSASPQLPTTVIGDESKLMGAPIGWVNIGNNLAIPVYGVKSDCKDSGK